MQVLCFAEVTDSCYVSLPLPSFPWFYLFFLVRIIWEPNVEMWSLEGLNQWNLGIYCRTLYILMWKSVFFFLLLWNDSNFHSSTALYLPYLQNVSENDYSLCLKKYLNVCFLVDLSVFNQLLLYCLKIYSGKIESLYRSWWIKNKWPNGRESIHDSLWIGLYNVKTWG